MPIPSNFTQLLWEKYVSYYVFYRPGLIVAFTLKHKFIINLYFYIFYYSDISLLFQRPSQKWLTQYFMTTLNVLSFILRQYIKAVALVVEFSRIFENDVILDVAPRNIFVSQSAPKSF